MHSIKYSEPNRVSKMGTYCKFFKDFLQDDPCLIYEWVLSPFDRFFMIECYPCYGRWGQI